MELRWFLPITIGELPVTTQSCHWGMNLSFPIPVIGKVSLLPPYHR